MASTRGTIHLRVFRTLRCTVRSLYIEKTYFYKNVKKGNGVTIECIVYKIRGNTLEKTEFFSLIPRVRSFRFLKKGRKQFQGLRFYLEFGFAERYTLFEMYSEIN